MNEKFIQIASEIVAPLYKDPESHRAVVEKVAEAIEDAYKEGRMAERESLAIDHSRQ